MQRDVTFPSDRSDTEATCSAARTDMSSFAKSARYKLLRAADLRTHGRRSRFSELVSRREVSCPELSNVKVTYK